MSFISPHTGPSRSRCLIKSHAAKRTDRSAGFSCSYRIDDEAADLHRRVLCFPSVAPVSDRPDVSAVSFPRPLGRTPCPSHLSPPCTAHIVRSWPGGRFGLLSYPLGSGSRGDPDFDDGGIIGT